MNLELTALEEKIRKILKDDPRLRVHRVWRLKSKGDEHILLHGSKEQEPFSPDCVIKIWQERLDLSPKEPEG